MTAVEWLAQEIINRHPEIIHFLPDWSFDKKIIEQAKQMEKEQLLNAYDNVYIDDNGNCLNGEQYYNETYGK